MGVPTVTVATTEFIALGKTTALSQGAADVCFVVVSHPMGMISLDEIKKKADTAFPEILKVSTQWKPTAKLPPMKPPYPAERFKFKGTGQDVSRLFFDKGWSLGLPIIPPTPERVARMLKGTSRKPDEVIGIVPPRMGVLTVEQVAVHAVMADCKPEYMPVLIAALEALLAPEASWRGAATTTGTSAALIVVNGPIVKEIGIAYEQGSAGKGHHANAAIGYAINFVTYTVGGSKPPSPDKGTLAAPSDFVCWIFGENEDALPKGWKPYHVDRGFKKTDSVVTFMGTYPPIDNIDHWSVAPEELVRWWTYLVSPLTNIGGSCLPMQMDLPVIIGLGPEHAKLLADSGWTKNQFREAFWKNVRMPFSGFPKGCSNKEVLEQKIGPVGPDTLIPIIVKPEYVHLVIAGGAGKHSHYFAPFVGCLPVSKPVKK